MRAFLKSQGGRVWRSIETGWTEPTETNTEGEKVAKSLEKYSKEEATLAECNDKALNALFGAVDSSQYRLISNCTEAKKAWEILETTHEGDERVKTAKLQILMTKYENLCMDDKEKIAEFHGRVRELANEAENLKRPFTKDSLVLKVLRALPESYAMDAKAIRQAHDIKNMTLDQLMGNLETIELQMNEEINQKKSVKHIAFHSHNTEEEDDDEDPSDGDYQEQLSLITKQFKKQWMQKKGRTNYQAESSKGFQFRNPRSKESKAPADDSKRRGPQCFEYPDSLTNRLVVLQEELDSLHKKLDETMQQLEQVEGEKANLNYELTQLKSYQKWMKSVGAEQIEDLVDKSRFYGDRTGIGHTLPESSKTPLDLFVTRSKIAAEELKEYNRDKKEALQPTHIHCHQLKYRRRKKGKSKGLTRTVMKWIPKHMASSANSCLRVTPDKWLLDSGCLHHMAGDKQNLSNIQPIEGGNVRFGGGAHGQIIGNGTLHVSGLPPIKNVWLVQGLEVNLLSISQIYDQGLEVVFTQQKCRIKDRNKFVVLEDDQLQHKATDDSLEVDISEKMLEEDTGDEEIEKGSSSLKQNPESETAMEHEEVQKAPKNGDLLNKEQDEAPLHPDPPTIMLLEYKTTTPLEEQHQHAEVDEEFQTLLDEEPLLAVSEVPFKKTETQDRTPRSSKKKAKGQNPVLWSKRKTRSEAVMKEESPPSTKKTRTSSPSPSKMSRSKRGKDLNHHSGKSSTHIFVTTPAKSYLPAIMKKNILPQHNIDLEDFALKTTLIPLLDARNFLKSVTLPGSYVKQVIYEFYCNLSEDFVNPAAVSFEKVFVRGKLYTFSSTAVNKFLGLDDDQDALGFNKKDGEQEEPLEPLMQIDNRHFDGKHFNDMKVADQETHGVLGVLKYLEHKLQQNKEALLLVDRQRKVP
ncbi:unnamed protein product [Cuscuta campestris]|uniref:Retrovirus-related Pol polyprotein from transposon TNT 1-94-like beta-barrel domain-containing protein n=1 Tax=Cuscuta campestris TaxID=132261 RepID=A0A484LLI6_9ASTE|nr:unnamed protein product [Cuscuta campestris]